MSSPRGSSLLPVCLVLALAGCSSSKEDKAPPPSKPATAEPAPPEPEPAEPAGPSCILSLEELRATLEMPELLEASSRTEGTVSMCMYDQKPVGVATIRIERRANPDRFDETRASFGDDTETIEGLGDNAFARTMGSGNNLLHDVLAIEGRTQVQVIAGGDRARVEAAVRQILERL
jgi:hypothetical protein